MIAGCVTSNDAALERGPDGTFAYQVKIESSEPGVRIDVNGESVGKTPMTLKIFGDRDHTFHNFGSYDFIVKAFPPGTGRDPQTKIYKTGALFAAEDKIPESIYFDFSPPPSTQKP